MSQQAEPPCVGLDPDTDPCPICGAALCEPCRRAPPAGFADVVRDHSGEAPAPVAVASPEFETAVAGVEQAVNAQLGGDASIADLVALMLRLGWRPPATAREEKA